MTDNESRSSSMKSTTSTDISKGVGARHKATTIPPGGGGYLDIYPDSEFSKKNDGHDPRLDELREIGLPKPWLDIAGEIGFDALLSVWHKLSSYASDQDNRHYVYVPRFSRWTRRQRNMTITALSATGLSNKLIQAKIVDQVGEFVSIAHIKRIISQSKKLID